MKKFDSIGRSLTKGEQKKIMGGDDQFLEPADGAGGCGHGISCSGKSSGDDCGSSGTCVCQTHDGGTWCNKQL